jgi:2-polyprenyl-3-methyl-5-hydroxy-6-metoxy-1,4-benzoquinol methylase
MENLENCVIYSLDGNSTDLLKHIPYILQDLWEFGTSSDVIVNQIKELNLDKAEQLKVLDLGCGKGAVSIKLAQNFGFKTVGFDAISDFIDFAKHKADEFNVSQLCSFYIDDIRKIINKQSDFDIIILGAISNVLGQLDDTLKLLSKSLKTNGLIILDDDYLLESNNQKNDKYLTKLDFFDTIVKNNFDCKSEYKMSQQIMNELDNDILEKIVQRSTELIEKFPDKRQLFEDYISAQKVENDILENQLQCSIFVLKKTN